VGVIGCGGRSRVITEAADVKGFQVVAACDCLLERAQKYVEELSGGKAWGVYDDFRAMIEKEQLDGVMIETTTHARAWIAVHAMQMGVDTYIEKPMCLTIAEGRDMVKAARKYKTVTQVGTQQRSMPINNWASDLVKNGALGKCKTVIGPNFVGPRRWTATSSADVKEPVAPWWDIWTNQAELRPHDNRLQYGWAEWWDYDGGGLCFGVTGWGAHSYDQINRALGTDDTGPVEVHGTGRFPDFAEPWNTAETFDIHYRYANGVTMHVWSEAPGIKFEGTKGWIMMRGWRQNLRASDDALLQLSFEGEKNLGRPECTVKARGGRGGEHVDFTNCVKSRKLCYYSAECGHRNHTISHMGNISMLLGGATLAWNPQTEKFQGDHADEANGHFCYAREQREPWTFANVDSWINVG